MLLLLDTLLSVVHLSHMWGHHVSLLFTVTDGTYLNDNSCLLLYNLNPIFVVLANIHIDNNNILLSKLIADIWEHENIA